MIRSLHPYLTVKRSASRNGCGLSRIHAYMAALTLKGSKYPNYKALLEYPIFGYLDPDNQGIHRG